MEENHPYVANRMALSPKDIEEINKYYFPMKDKPTDSVVYHLSFNDKRSMAGNINIQPNVL